MKDTSNVAAYMNVDLTLEEIKKYFPNQVVGLTDIQYCFAKGGKIKSAKVVCTEKDTDKNSMDLMAYEGKIKTIYTTLDEDFSGFNDLMKG